MSNTQQRTLEDGGFDPTMFNFKNFMQQNPGFNGA